MTDEMQTLRDDIAYLKGLAEAGRNGAPGGGMIMMAAGGFFGGASFVQWLILGGVVALPTVWPTAAWSLALIGFFATLFVVKRAQGGAGTDRGAALAWQGIGWAIFTIFLAISVATWRTHDVLLVSFSPSIILALYGAAWSVAAALTRKRWIQFTALASFAAAVGSAWFVADPVQFLLYAIALILLAFLPGWALVRGAPGGAV